MTKKQKLMEQSHIRYALREYECGRVDFIEAVDYIVQYYKYGAIDKESATEAIKLLAKVKTPKEV